MPIELKERQPETLPPQEVILTPEDRERLSVLIEEIGGETLYALDRRERLSWGLRLRQEGDKAAAFILEMAENTNPDLDEMQRGGFLNYKYSKWLDYCITPNMAERLGGLLVKDEIAVDPDRSTKITILETLKRAGVAKNVRQLCDFFEKTIFTQYPNPRFIKLDAKSVFEALVAIQLRTTDEEDLAAIERAKNEINAILFENNLTPFNQEEIVAMMPQAESSILQEKFESRFSLSFVEQEENEPPRIPFEGEWWDDAEITSDYQEGKFQDVEARLEVVKRLRHEARKEKGLKEEPEEDGDTKFLRKHWLEYKEENPSPYAPTLGIEIEIRERTVVPPIPESKLDAYLFGLDDPYLAAREKFIREKKKKYARTEELGLPGGVDKFWEFAHKPSRYYLTLSREVQALIELDLINKEDRKHALHLSVGGVTSESGLGSSGVHLLARTLEATGWSTTGRRLIRPKPFGLRSWDVKGMGGVLERHRGDIQLGSKSVVEIRTFQLQSLAGLDRLLRSGFFLGSALKAFQESDLSESQNQETKAELANLWAEFASDSMDLFKKYGLQNPSFAWIGPSTIDAPKNEFESLAQLLNQAAENKDSEGAKFVSEMRRLVIKARSDIAKTMSEK